MDDNYEVKGVQHILMNVIGDALIKADASFMFGVDFKDILDKYTPLLRRKTLHDTVVQSEIDTLKEYISGLEHVFPGSTYDLIMKQIEQIEYDVCKDPENILA